MTQRKVKKQAIYLTIGICSLVGVLALTEISMNPEKKEKNDYVNKTIFENNIPVIADPEIIIRPYTDNNVKIVTNYYNQSDPEETQRQSLIFYENTYLPSTGIDYQADYDFDVVAVLDGVVLSIKEDQILGNVIEIKHSDDIVSTYQSLSEINVKEGDAVKQNQIIGKSGNSNIQKEMGSHLHFELNIGNKTVDPEEYYNKELGTLN